MNNEENVRQQGEFSMTVKLDSDAMAPDDLANALCGVAALIKDDGELAGRIRDINGNTVGHWNVSVMDVCTTCGQPHSL